MKQSLKATLLLSAFATCFSAFAQDVKVTSNIPAEVEAGKEFTVELTVNKGDVSGFAKLQQELPTGFSATPENPNGSTFSFKEQKVKFLWMALPGDKTFKVSYKVKVDASVIGDQILDGSFSYILNNETQKAALPKDIIKVTASGTAVANAAASQPKVSTVESNPQGSTQQAKSAETSSSSSEVTATSPSNAEAEALAKRKEEEARVKSEKAERDRKAAEQKAAAASATSGLPDPIQIKSASTSSPKAAGRVNGLVYRVQVAATKRKVEGSDFKAQFNLSDNVAWEEHEGWNKYVIGEFQNYKAAKAYSNNVRDNNGVPGPFVTSYLDGVRISVQEALEKQGR